MLQSTAHRKDNLVRETHKYLEGQSVPLEEEFFTYDGDHAPYPGVHEGREQRKLPMYRDTDNCE